MTVAFVEEYRSVVDKSGWGPGPWQDEPDKAVWVDEATGLDCMIVRGPVGALCGYVGVPEGHPWHGKGYSEHLAVPCEEHAKEDGYCYEHAPDARIEVHGGLTFADRCCPGENPAEGICHLPQTGRPDKVWWFGFDCAHAFDVAPRMAADYRKRYEEARAEGDAEGMRLWGHIDSDTHYRSFPHVVRECERLAEQLAAVGGDASV